MSLFKLRRTYAVAYTIRPNKKTDGVKAVMSMTIVGKYAEMMNQAKVLRSLCYIHRVNPGAIEVNGVTLLKTHFNIVGRLRDAAYDLFKRFARAAQ